MSFRLWLRGGDEAGCIDLGLLVPTLKAMQEWARALPDDELEDEEKWGALFWLPNADDQDLPQEYVDALRPQVARMLAEHGGDLSAEALSVLRRVDAALAKSDAGIAERQFGGHDSATVQADLPPQLAARVVDYGRGIADEDLGEDGREDRPHVTVLYGLETSSVDAVRSALAGVGPGRVTLGALGVFRGDGQDVLYFEASGDVLAEARAAVSRLPNAQAHDGYVPHATVAYVAKGHADVLEGASVPGVSGESFPVEWLSFISSAGMEVALYLCGGTGE